MEIVDAQDRVEIVEKFSGWQELADRVSDHRRAALTTAHQDAETDLAVFVAYRLRADIVDQRGGAVGGGAGNGNLEFARQEREFRIQRRPLPQQFAPGAGVDDLVGGHSREAGRS